MRFLRRRLWLIGVAVLIVVAAVAAASTMSSNSPRGNRRTQLAACLKKQGVTLPRRAPGAHGAQPESGAENGHPGSGAEGSGQLGFDAQRGGNDAIRRAALRRCGVNPQREAGPNGDRGSFAHSPASRRALASFAACVRRNGYRLPNPNTSGNGPVFNPRQVDRSNPRFLAAARRCQSLLPRGTGPSPGPVPGSSG